MPELPDLPPEVLAMIRRAVALPLPGMDAVSVTKNLAYADEDDGFRRMDVYRAPDLEAATRLPAVIFIHGGGPPGAHSKELGAFQSYGRLAAVQGMVGVTFNHRLEWPRTRLADGTEDLAAALAYVRANAEALSIDADRLALWAFSAGGPQLAPHLADAAPHIQALVAYYPFLDIEGSETHRMAETGEDLIARNPLRQLGKPGRKAPLYLARAGADHFEGLLAGIDRFVGEALVADYPLTLANNPAAPHGFDIGEGSPRTLEILQDTFAFLRRHLTVYGSANAMT